VLWCGWFTLVEKDSAILLLPRFWHDSLCTRFWVVVGIPTFAGVLNFVSFMEGNLLWSFLRGLVPRSTIGVGIAAMLNMVSVLSARLPPR